VAPTLLAGRAPGAMPDRGPVVCVWSVSPLIETVTVPVLLPLFSWALNVYVPAAAPAVSGPTVNE